MYHSRGQTQPSVGKGRPQGEIAISPNSIQMDLRPSSRFEQRFYRLAFFALWLQGCLTFLAVHLVVAYVLLGSEQVFHRLNLKLPSFTEALISASSLLSHPATALLLTVVWTVVLLKLRRWKPDSIAEAENERQTVCLEIALALHVGLNCVMLTVGVAAAVPFMQLLGCL